MKLSFTFLLYISICLGLSAKTTTITGTITAQSDNLPLSGVNVLIKNTSSGTQTDFNGYYEIEATKGDILVFSFVGMVTQQVKVDSQTYINIVMEDDNTHIEEVVVMGYASKRRTSNLSSVTQNTSNRKSNKRKSNGVQNLSGRVAGVHVNHYSSNPGNSSNIVLRGNSSINSNKEPLYIIDGIPVSRKNSEDLKNIKPEEIKDLKVLKGDAATSIYGKRAIHGCIIINTKGGNYIAENNESYEEITENLFEKTQLSPLSTFSIDVDKAAYSNIRRMLNNGQKIPVDAVRIEEMINYFSYNYPQPTDDHPFSITSEAIKTPWNADTKLVKIGLQGKTYKQDKLPPSNLTFLIDVSGSMSDSNKLPLLKSAFKLLVNQLREQDKVSIVVYAGAAGVVLKPTSGNNKKKILEALDKLNAGGSTAGGAGIILAYKLAEKNFKKNGNNRVILATDGDFNVGRTSDKAMEKLIEEKRKSGVFLSVLGFGYGNIKDSKLETLADKGNGNHAYIDTMQEAQKVFGQEFGGTLYTIAKDVKIQVEFNPANVQAYRLIGYENRLLDDEDFIDDTKDAGELGSGHSVTAIYEVIPTGVQSDYLKKVSDLKYTETATYKDSDELFTVKFRYKKPDGDKSIEMVHVQRNELSEATPDLKFVSAVALFGMHLRQSQFYNNAPIAKVIELAKAGRGQDENGYRAEFIRLVESYQGS